MVDETEFRDTLNRLGLVFCPFGKTILNNHCQCEQSRRHLLAGREIAGCKYEAAARDCAELLTKIRRNSSFALKIRDQGVLPHGKAIRIQTGGLSGLADAYRKAHPGANAGVDNIFRLIHLARAYYGDLEQFPYGEMVKSIAAFKGRRQGR